MLSGRGILTLRLASLIAWHWAMINEILLYTLFWALALKVSGGEEEMPGLIKKRTRKNRLETLKRRFQKKEKERENILK